MSDEIRVSSNNFRYATPQKRFLALLIDMLIVNLLVLLIVPGAAGIFALLNLSAILDWSLENYLITFPGIFFIIFPAVYLVLLWGWLSRTIGMIVMKTKVADAAGKNIGWVTALFRVLAYALSGLILCLGFLPILFDKKRQGLHDKITKTFVIMKK